MVLEILQQDIDNGVRYSASKCPAALAMTRQIGRRQSCGITCIGDHPMYLVPLSLEHFIRAFDAGKTVKPGKFVLMEDK